MDLDMTGNWVVAAGVWRQVEPALSRISGQSHLLRLASMNEAMLSEGVQQALFHQSEVILTQGAIIQSVIEGAAFVPHVPE